MQMVITLPAILFKETERYREVHPVTGSVRSASWEPVGDATVPANGGEQVV
jgi:hypothetical protein